MADFLRWLTGLGNRTEAKAVEWRLEFQSLPQGPWAVATVAAFALAIFGVAWLYRREGRDLPLGVRLTLSTIRLAAITGVAVMLFELVAIQSWRESIKSQLLVLVDGSQSMALHDPYPNESFAGETARNLGWEGMSSKAAAEGLRQKGRLDLAKLALQRLAPALEVGRELQLYSFGGKLDSPRKMEGLDAVKPTEATTAIGDAVRDALAAHRGQPIAGVLLVSDGRSNAGADPLPIAEAAGKTNVPIVSLAVGTSEGPRNLRLADLQAPPVAFVRDPMEIPVLVESRGMKGSQATVSLEMRMDDGPWQEIGSQIVALGEDGAVQRVAFRHSSDVIGRMELRARAGDAGPELTLDDNTATAAVKIVRQKIRVLLLAGNPTPEVQFLRNALQRDKTLEFSGWLQNAGEGYEQAGDRPLQRLPATQQELDRYDVLLMVDPDMQSLGSLWSEMLTNFVGRTGGGLIYVAGESYTPTLFSPQTENASLDNSWLKIMPIVRDPGLYQSSAEVQLSSLETWTLELTQQGQQDQVFEFNAEPSRNREILSSLPGMYWHFPVTRAKSGATVLARHGDPRMKNNFGRHVLLATHLYGPGRTVFCGFDSTYRWRYLDEQHFDGFWARLIDRVGRSKVLGGGYPFTLNADKNTYRVGDRVTLTARFLNPADGARELTGLAGELEAEGRPAQTVNLEPVPHDPESFQTNFIATEAGNYRLRVQTSASPDPDAAARPATMSFRVEPPRRELDNPTLNMALLESMARASGGKVFTLAEADALPAAFTVHEVSHPLEESRELWNAPMIFLGVLFLLTLEWILRKRYRMA